MRFLDLIHQLTAAGAMVTSLIGLIGFAVACVYVIYLFKIKSDERALRLLPQSKRAQHIDTWLTRYKLTLADLSADRKYDLVLREMNLRSKKQLGFASLGAVVFLTSVAIIAFGPVSHPNPNPNPNERVRTEADNTVLGYMKEILVVRGDWEARDRNPGVAERVRGEAIRLAKLISGIADEKLNPSRRVIKEEYGGWALLLAARTYDLAKRRDERISHAEEALAYFNRAIAKMEAIKRDYEAGNRFAAEDFEWIMSESADWDRTLYLKAMALAVVAQAGGSATKLQVRDILGNVSAEYKTQYPMTNVEELRWALDNKS